MVSPDVPSNIDTAGIEQSLADLAVKIDTTNLLLSYILAALILVVIGFVACAIFRFLYKTLISREPFILD